jgi:SSS family solute:Na+ symporter
VKCTGQLDFVRYLAISRQNQSNMNLHPVDLAIVVAYLALVALVGFLIRKKASSGLDNYFLAGRNLPWWVLGIAGCSSYIDIAGIMALIGALFYLGLKTVWMTNIFWGWFTMAGYMAFRASCRLQSGTKPGSETTGMPKWPGWHPLFSCWS